MEQEGRRRGTDRTAAFVNVIILRKSKEHSRQNRKFKRKMIKEKEEKGLAPLGVLTANRTGLDI